MKKINRHLFLRLCTVTVCTFSICFTAWAAETEIGLGIAPGADDVPAVATEDSGAAGAEVSGDAAVAEEGGNATVAEESVTAAMAGEGSTDTNGRSRVLVCGSGASTADADADTKDTAELAGGAEETGTRGVFLGMFTTTGYCGCADCSGDHTFTYSGTVPRARHTLSADLNRFPIGTKLMIGDVIYTVEDMGSAVKGNWLDIYYDNHEQADAHGMKTEEVFTVVEE